MNSQNNLGFFIDDFINYRNKTAIIFEGEEVSYATLTGRIRFWEKGFDSIYNGKVIGIESDFSPETIAILFALISIGAVIVPLDKNHKDKNEQKAVIAQLDFMIEVNSEDNVTIRKLSNDEEKNQLYKKLGVGNPGLVLFTSGSSGKPKAALHDFSKLLAKFKLKRKALRTVNFLLFDHWGGLNTLFHILSNGGTLYILENRTPDYVSRLIEKYEVELLPTSPTFLNMLLLSKAYTRYSLKSLKVISYGAEPMPENLLKLLNQIFPDVKLQQTYGLIELGVMRSQSENNNSLWVKLGGEGFESRIVDNMLQIKSESAMLGYLNAESPFTEDGWFKTGDAVEIKGEYFKILGRKSELINVGGEKVYPQEIENLILEIDNIKDVVIYGEKHPMTGNIVCAKVVLVEPEELLSVKQRIRTYCKQRVESFKVPVKIFIEEDPLYSERFKKNRQMGNN